MNNILCFGEILWDTFGDEKVAGGAPMNVARHLAQQGMPVMFASSVGADNSGDKLIAFLKSSNLYSPLVQTDANLPTCEVTVQLDSSGQATYIIPEPVSWDNICTTSELTAAAKDASAIIYGSLACREETTKSTLLNLLSAAKALKIFDVNLRPPHYSAGTIATFIANADVVKMNEDELLLLTGSPSGDIKKTISDFRDGHPAKTICVTRGEYGAIVLHNGAFFEHPGFTVEVEDTVGAGDSFLATFVAGLLKDEPMNEVLEKASFIGAFVAGKRGANPVYGAKEIDYLNSGK